jgi:Tfp pilus assembly protein PilE
MLLKINPPLDALKKQTASTTMQVKKNPQLDAKNKQAASTTTMQVKKNPQLDAKNKSAASTTTVQVKTKPQLDARNKPAASTTTMQAKKNPQIDALNKRLASITTVQVKPNPKFDALNKRLPYSAKNIPPNKERKSVAKTYQPHFRPIKEHKSGGGTLRIIEPFVVLIIISILAHIALPSFLSCGNKSKHSEAKQYVGSMNRAQEAKYAESGAFSNSITALGLGIKTQTTNYNYSVRVTKKAAFNYAVSRKNLKSYVGAVGLVQNGEAMTIQSILCEANSRENTQPANPIFQNNVPVCAAGSSEVTK